MKPLDEESWDALAQVVSKSLLLYGYALTSDYLILAEELRTQIQILPLTDKEVYCSISPDAAALPNDLLRVLLTKLFDSLRTSPSLVVLLRGKSHEEFLELIRAERSTAFAAGKALELSRRTAHDSSHSNALMEPSRYWKQLDDVMTIAQTIRADELPASLLKRLDLPPLLELSEKAEVLLEQIYTELARRAQIIAFQMRSAGSPNLPSI